MIKLTIYGLLCFVFSAHTMNLDTVCPDSMKKICQYIDSQEFDRLIDAKLDGDILFISPEQKRTKDTLFTYISLKDTNLKALGCVNKNLFNKITAFFENYNKRISLKESLYIEPLTLFFQKDFIEFFQTEVRKDGKLYNINSTLQNINFGNNVIYKFTINVKEGECSPLINPFLNEQDCIKSISSMLFACIENGTDQQHREQVEQIIDHIELLISSNLKNKNLLEVLNDDEGIFLDLNRIITDHDNWNMFSFELFCQLINLGNILSKK